MPQLRIGLVVTCLALSIPITTTGCMSASRGPSLNPPMLSSRPNPPAQGPTITPQNVVRWSIASGVNSKTPAITGREMIAPDGTLRLGPYGSVQVAGMTAEEARAVIHTQVARQVPDPRISLQIETPTSNRPFQKLFGKNNDPPLNSAEAQKGWQFGKQTESTGGRLTPVAQPPQGTQQTSGRHNLLSGRDKSDPSQVRRVSADEPELAPQPGVLTVPPGMPHGVPGEKAPPRELAEVLLPPYIIDPPDVLLVAAHGTLPIQKVEGQHLVRPDGSISLGIYGSVRVAGLTLDQARDVIALQLKDRAKVDPKDVSVDVLAYNSKVYYIITDGAGYGEQVVRLPITGRENVLDALSLINGLPPVASKKHIWVARRTPMDGGGHQILPVDWVGITQRGVTATNYQVMPGDRIYVQSDKLLRIDNGLAKILNPIERLLGVTLLGSSVVNSIQGRNLGGGGGF